MEWPMVILVLGILALLAILIAGGNFRLGAGGGELSVNTVGILENLRRANETKSGTDNTLAPAAPAFDPHLKQRRAKLPLATILWVDDEPLNNIFERQAFANAGIFCDSYTTNTEALEALNSTHYDVIISDIGRGSGAETGWELLAKVKRSHAEIPFVFYTFKVDEEKRSKARNGGAYAITELPDELARVLFDLISRSS